MSTPPGVCRAFKYGNFIAHAGQIAGCGKSGWTGTDHCNFMTVWLRFFRLAFAFFAHIVGNKALEAADGHRFAFNAAYAIWIRTATPAGRHGRRWPAASCVSEMMR